MKDEIGQYSKNVKPDADSNPLEWWKIHESAYPTLAILVKKYLCVCAFSCASEWLFSTSGHVASKKSNLLKPNKLNTLVFLIRNYSNISFCMYVMYVLNSSSTCLIKYHGIPSTAMSL